jgi:dihydrofolate synthase/folylpolyglutamate synthase
MLSESLIDDLVNPKNFKIIPGKDRVERILAALDNPHNTYKIIHITGTNGKGSTASFIETGLFHAGFKVGKFTSPHLLAINETIALNLQAICDFDLEKTYLQIKEKVQEFAIELTQFEMLTVIMFEYFKQKKIDWLILEVGMGGLHDATNVVNSNYAIITNVALEHCQWLGNSISEIAHHKAGIIKNGKTILGTNDSEVIHEVNKLDPNYIDVITHYKPIISLDGSSFTTQIQFQDNLVTKKYNLSLFGKFQGLNFLCAYFVFKDLSLNEDSINYAAISTKWPGRLQVIAKNPYVILDATHNLAGAENLKEALNGLFNKDNMVIITSILKDKKVKEMLQVFATMATSVIFTSIKNNLRGMTCKELSAIGSNFFTHTYECEEPKLALKLAQTLNKKVILITGSTYLLALINEKPSAT